MNRKQMHDKGWDAIKDYIDNAFDCCYRSADVRAFAADICARYDKWEQAIKFIDMALEMKPSDDRYLVARTNYFISLAKLIKEVDKKNQLLHEAKGTCAHLRAVSDQSRATAITSIYEINNMLPLDYEKN
jgi:hypothetical protein